MMLCRSRDGNSRASQLKLAAACSQAHLPACNVSTEYIASGLERQWLQHVEVWQKSFCSSLQAVENSTTVWLQTNARLTSLQQQYLQADNSPAQVSRRMGLQQLQVFAWVCQAPTQTEYLCVQHNQDMFGSEEKRVAPQTSTSRKLNSAELPDLDHHYTTLMV